MTSGLFKIIPKVSGTLQIKYTLSGKNQKNFAPLSDTMVYVQAVDALNHLTRIPNKYFMRNQCHKIKLDVCNNGQEIKLLSSCPWSRKGSKGYQSIVAGGMYVHVVPKTRALFRCLLWRSCTVNCPVTQLDSIQGSTYGLQPF